MYKVSVITPFHNVELNIFEKAYQSMKSQTIGFENIQWIVIAHNCEPHFLPAIPANRPYAMRGWVIIQSWLILVYDSN